MLIQHDWGIYWVIFQPFSTDPQLHEQRQVHVQLKGLESGGLILYGDEPIAGHLGIAPEVPQVFQFRWLKVEFRTRSVWLWLIEKVLGYFKDHPKSIGLERNFPHFFIVIERYTVYFIFRHIHIFCRLDHSQTL